MAVRPSGPPRAVREAARTTSLDCRAWAGFPVALALAVAVGIALVLVAGTGAAAVGTAAVGTAAVGTAAAGTAAVGTAAAGPPAAARSAGVVPPAVPGSSVFVLGVPGLRWDDLSATRTPQLWKLATEGAIAALIVRGADEATPPADGWGTLSAGNRVRVPGGLAEVPPPPGPAVMRGRYPGMELLIAAQGPTHTGAEPGALGEAVRSGARCTTAAGGSGALLAASDASGRVSGYGADVGEHSCPLTVAEPDVAPDASPAQRLTAADVLAGQLADLRHDDDSLLVVAVGDPPAGGAHLSVAIAVGPAFPAGTELTSASTGRVPFVQLVDVAPTALALMGIDAPKSMIGQPWGATSGVAGLASRQARYEDLDTAARQAHRAVPLVVCGCGGCGGDLARCGRGADGVRRPYGPAGPGLAWPPVGPAHQLRDGCCAGSDVSGQPCAVVAWPVAAGAGGSCGRGPARPRHCRGRPVAPRQSDGTVHRRRARHLRSAGCGRGHGCASAAGRLGWATTRWWPGGFPVSATRPSGCLPSRRCSPRRCWQ